MVRKYALDPNVVHDLPAFAAFVQGLGVDQGRLLAEYPSKWRQIAIEQLQRAESASTSTRQAKTAEILLGRLRTEAYLRTKSGAAYAPEVSWIANAAKNAGAFDAAIYADDTVEHANVVGLYPASSLLSNAEYWAAATLQRFDSTAPEYVRVLRPLLELSTSAAIMDPYFRPEKRYLDFLRTLSESIPGLLRLSIHSSGIVAAGGKHQSKEQWQAAWEAHIGPALRSNLTLQVVRWRARDNDKPHERWLVTPVGGVSLDRGVQVDGLVNKAQLLPTSETARLWSMYGSDSYRSAAQYTLQDFFDMRGSAP